ncbi:hypothetical protein TSUD_135620 [Trifolium subterraneum]|uniref:Uncharacterized protein n=1 Tax=Trifolium subterraneum TaxID=3900 RepID=A0A2Z6PFG4_TRISU|nr:hypothetical protein TSUD_135620 [Trifolium subterraneum]
MDVLKRGMNLIGDSERREFDRRCMRLKVQEAKLRVQRAELLEEQQVKSEMDDEYLEEPLVSEIKEFDIQNWWRENRTNEVSNIA